MQNGTALANMCADVARRARKHRTGIERHEAGRRSRPKRRFGDAIACNG